MPVQELSLPFAILVTFKAMESQSVFIVKGDP